MLAGVRMIDVLRLERTPGVKAGDGDGVIQGQRESTCQACGNRNYTGHFGQKLQCPTFLLSSLGPAHPKVWM